MVTEHAPIARWETWLATSKGWGVFAYARGRSMFSIDNKPETFRAAWDSYCAGDVYLLQRKLGNDNYEYLAIKKPPARAIATRPKRDVLEPVAA